MAGLANGGSVDDRGDLLDVAGQETVEEVDVCVSQVGEVLVLVNGILLVLEELKASLFLCLEALDGGRSQAVCAEVLADLNGVCGVVVGASEKKLGSGTLQWLVERNLLTIALMRQQEDCSERCLLQEQERLMLRKT